jgi:hypothetical protein
MSIALDPAEGLVLVPVRIWGPGGHLIQRFALDTGSTTTVVSWTALALLGYDPAGAPERAEMTTGSSVEHVPMVTVVTIEALGLRRRDFEVACHDLPAGATVHGLLGLDFHRNQRLTVDFRQGLVSLD